MPDLMVLLPMVALLMCIGAFAGVVAGLLGVGGGVVLVPAFFYLFAQLGYDGPQLMQVCLATSLATIIVTSLRSVQSHHRKGAVDWSILRTWAPGIALGAVIGVLVAQGLHSGLLQIIFGVLGCFIAVYFAFGRADWTLARSLPGGVWRAVLSPVIGFLSVLMGIGGGSFGVPLMTLSGTPMHRAVATAAGFGVTIAFPSVIAFIVAGLGVAGLPPLTLGFVNIPAFLIVISMTLITAPIGARLAHALPVRPLRLIFAVFIAIMALSMLRSALWS